MSMNKKVKLKHIIMELGLFVLIFSLISYMYESNVLLTIILLFAWGMGIFLWHTKRDVIIFVVSAVLGSIGNIVCVKFGVWTYTEPVFMGIPPWLPIALGEAALFFYKISNYIYYKFNKKK